MYFCKKLTKLEMFSRLNDVLQTAAEVLAPPPSPLQDFEYHWKQVKSFYTCGERIAKVHINDTSIPFHLEEMLQIIIREETTLDTQPKECLEFVYNSRPMDLLSELAVTDSPPGATVLILNWLRRFLSCLPNPQLSQESVFQPIQKLIQLCNGTKASPYEQEEILFLSTVSGFIRKEPFLINLFLPSHQHSAYVNLNLKQNKQKKIPVHNPLFECTKVESNIRRISILLEGAADDTANIDQQAKGTDVHLDSVPVQSADSSSVKPFQRSDSCISTVDSCSIDGPVKREFECDCEKTEDRLYLLDAILSYLESPDSLVVVRACEGALILASLPSLSIDCNAIKSSLTVFSEKISQRLSQLCQQIPEDMDTGDIEDCNVSWGLVPREQEQAHFVGRAQLSEFLCWLDYSNCLSAECPAMATYLCERIQTDLLESVIEPSMLDMNAPFMLVLASKIVRQLDSRCFSDELANWLVGREDDNAIGNDCLLSILVENAYENSEILLPTLQFIESLLDNTNERILNGMLFRYINCRGYYDGASQQPVQSWSDEEDERQQRRGSIEYSRIRSRTLAPTNILKVINNYLLLLPRQIMSESVGTCYEEYVQDASRHYQNWITRTEHFDWPIEACTLDKSDLSPEANNSSYRVLSAPGTSATKKDIQCNDSGISEEAFYEGPLLRMLFVHVRCMASHPYELNLAVIAILSKLAFLPHPYLHEILLNPYVPIVRGTNTLWSSMQHLAQHLLMEVPRKEGFQRKIAETGRRLLTNPPVLSESNDECDPLFESLVVLEEFCKELAAIAFVKYHHATE